MKIALLFVSTLDGKVTKWGDPKVKKWSSREDQQYFRKLWKSSNLIVMGSNSFKAEAVTPLQDHLVIVMTHHPAEYSHYEIKGRIEFTDESPVQLTLRLAKEGYEIMLLLGGPRIATAFFKEKLIDELWLTIEPLLFGTGDKLIVEEEIDVRLKLLSLEKANEMGTLITRYAVLK